MRGKLKSLRKEQNLTQESLSNMVNIHRTYYSMIENGRRNPSIQFVNKSNKSIIALASE